MASSFSVGVTGPKDSDSSPPLLPKVLVVIPAIGAAWPSKRASVISANKNASPRVVDSLDFQIPVDNLSPSPIATISITPHSDLHILTVQNNSSPFDLGTSQTPTREGRVRARKLIIGKTDKNKKVVPYQPKPKHNPLKRKENPNKDQTCHHCHVAGHWKRNCPLYLEELRKNKDKAEHGAAALGNLFTIELFNLTYKLNSWVYDTGCSIHVCNTLQGFKEKIKLSYGEQYLQVGNGAQAAVKAIRVFDLVLPSGLVLKLNNCYYEPSIIRGVVSLSCLLDLGFNHTIASNEISVFLNGLFYFSAVSVNGVFEIDMNNNVFKNNNNSIFSINKKRKLDLDSFYLWHCRLAHIGKTRMQKLQREGLLKSINDESFDNYESCISGKMTKKPFNNNIERATDLLGLIHTDVCGPLRHVSRKGASYFLTFTDDFSHRMCLYIDAEEHELGDLGEPANYKAALLDPESKKWLDAMNVEMQSMKDNDTDMDGAVYIFKARLVAKGFTQTYGVDYEETFSHVADIRAIRILIAIAAYYDYEIWQIDVKTAFLKGHLFEEVYMEQPEGFVNPKYPNHVCKLKRSIYGLKQASRQWNKRFDDEIKKFGFTQNPDEPCVYVKASGSYVAILILYVDDILLMGNNIPMLQDVKSYLGRSFAMKDLGEAAYILGIKIYRDRSKRLIGLCQNAYIEKILKRFYMENSKRGTIPMQEKLKLSKSQGASTPAEKQRMQNISYALVVGSIMYAMRCTRPDVAFAQNMTSHFQQNPDAEYIAAFDASNEAVWIRKFISGLGIVPTIEEPISMYYDNTEAIAIAKDDRVTKGANDSYPWFTVFEQRDDYKARNLKPLNK
nr:retrotransposon protein, putative, Ty1-copia subclass [Tanacetum cinerariifolium]